jgi:hypothetical protein
MIAHQLVTLISLGNGGEMTQARLSAVTSMDHSTINEIDRARPDQQIRRAGRQEGHPSGDHKSRFEDA